MATIAPWLTAAELAALGLPGLPGSERRWREAVERLGLVSRRRAGRGGGLEYAVASLPREAREELARRALLSTDAAADDAPTVAAPPARVSRPSELADWQRATMTARLILLQECERIAATGLSLEAAIAAVVEASRVGTLPEHLARQVPIANARSNKTGRGQGGQILSRRTIYRWRAERREGGAANLAPATAPRAPESIVPPWAKPMMDIYRQPQKPSLAAVLEKLPAELPLGVPMPSYDQARRFLARVGNVERHRGRMGPREIKALLPYIRRDTETLQPLDVCTADGHTLDAEWQHPEHGRPFRPEVTTILDAGTRRAIGWSVSLAESTWAHLDALRHAVERAGICAVYYTDRGGGFDNDAMTDPFIGFFARLGITHERALPQNSQARGLIERSHQTIWVRGAKDLPTYMGAAMDRDAKNAAFKLTRSELLTPADRPLLPQWRDFHAWAQAQVDAYNARPHRALPKIRDQATGKMRHMSPDELWARWEAAGWQPERPTAEDLEDLFRPYTWATVSRGQVTVFHNVYFSKALTEYHGERLRVGYDIHDAARVWVRDDSERLIAVAEWDANKRAYFPQPVIDQAKEKRADGRRRRVEAKLAEIEAERAPGALIDLRGADELTEIVDAQLRRLRTPAEALPVPAAPEAPAPTPAPIAVPAPAPVPVAPRAPVVELAQDLPTPSARPLWQTDREKFEWLDGHPNDITDDDRGWLAWYATTTEYRLTFGRRRAAPQIEGKS